MAEEKRWPEDAQRDARFSRPNLPRHERLFNWEKRNRIIDQGKAFKYDTLLISILPQSFWELSIVIKRSAGKASQRNESKRKIKEAYRLSKPLCPAPAAIAITVTRKPENLRVGELKKFLETNIRDMVG